MTMHLLDLSFNTPEENLACDEALLEHREQDLGPEILRFWESQRPFVVLGLSKKVTEETQQNFCETQGIPILRRASGGGTVLQGPGCFNYSLILKIKDEISSKDITQANQFVMAENKKALSPLFKDEILIQGITDLCVGQRKFSGNAQKRKKNYYLFHGTILTHFDLSLIEKTLLLPEIRPEYRENRTHLDFVMNTQLDNKQIKDQFIRHWKAEKEFTDVPTEIIKKLVEDKYSRKEWNYKL